MPVTITLTNDAGQWSIRADHKDVALRLRGRWSCGRGHPSAAAADHTGSQQGQKRANTLCLQHGKSPYESQFGKCTRGIVQPSFPLPLDQTPRELKSCGTYCGEDGTEVLHSRIVEARQFRHSRAIHAGTIFASTPSFAGKQGRMRIRSTLFFSASFSSAFAVELNMAAFPINIRDGWPPRRRLTHTPTGGRNGARSRKGPCRRPPARPLAAPGARPARRARRLWCSRRSPRR